MKSFRVVLLYTLRLALAVLNFTFTAQAAVTHDWFSFGFSLFAGAMALTWAVLGLAGRKT